MTDTNEITRYICLFHSQERARAAVDALQKLNIAPDAIRSIGGDQDGSGVVNVQALGDLGVPERDRKHLQDGLQHGGVLVSLEAPESMSAGVEKVFHHYSADKIDETEVQAAFPTFDAAAATGSSDGAAGDVVIPVAEEVLEVGKRDVDQGGVRVFRRTVSEPVQAAVDLHEENVTVQRREVNRSATDADLLAGSQQFELIETSEVPVVQKIARVVEEVHVGKVESDRVETVGGTVRHTEVSVEQLPEDGSRIATVRN